MAPALVSVTSLSHSYDSGTQALTDVGLAVEEGAFVSLVGPSGCGKSTLLRIIAGLVTPTAGTVTTGVTGARGEIGFVFQDPTLMPWATIHANVALPLQLRGVPESGIDEALARVGLSDFAAAYPRQLSGGMKMRASIARAMVTSPKLLLMDEPFAALDEFTRFKLNDDLLALWRANRWTVIFVTHSVREAAFLSQRVVVMTPRPGRIAADVNLNLPVERTPELRSSHAFADECARIGRYLHEVSS